MNTALAKAVCGLILLFAFAAQTRAGEPSCEALAVKLPAHWEVVQAPEARDGLCSAVYGGKREAASVMLGEADAKGLSAGEMARDVAALLHVRPEREEHLDKVRFWGQRDNVAVACSVTVHEGHLRFVCLFGDEGAGEAFVKKTLPRSGW